MTGVLMDLEAVMKSSRNRGIPSVTFASPLPVQKQPVTHKVLLLTVPY